MNDVLSKVFIFAAGAAIGSVVTWKLVKTKYEKIAQEEIESIRELYYEQHDNRDSEDSDEDYDEEEVRDEYERVIDSNGYTHAEAKTAKKIQNEEKDGEEEVIEPYVIIPEEFDENGYDTVTLYYFADGVVTYVDYEVVTNVDGLIGEDSLNHFGEYEEDTVFVRNDNIKTDFEIQRDLRSFSEVD